MLLPYLVQLKDAAAPLTAFLHPGVSVLSEYCAAVGMDGDYFWRLLKSWLDPLREIGCAFLQCSSLTAWSYQHGFASTNRGWEWFCPLPVLLLPQVHWGFGTKPSPCRGQGSTSDDCHVYREVSLPPFKRMFCCFLFQSNHKYLGFFWGGVGPFKKKIKMWL